MPTSWTKDAYSTCSRTDLTDSRGRRRRPRAVVASSEAEPGHECYPRLGSPWRCPICCSPNTRFAAQAVVSGQGALLRVSSPCSRSSSVLDVCGQLPSVRRMSGVVAAMALSVRPVPALVPFNFHPLSLSGGPHAQPRRSWAAGTWGDSVASQSCRFVVASSPY